MIRSIKSGTTKKPLPEFKTDDEAEQFVAEADLTEYDLSDIRMVRFEFEPKGERVQNLRLYVSKYGRSELLTLLDEKEIRYAERHPARGTIIASADIVGLIDTTAKLLGIVATVLGLWLSRNKA